MKPIQVGLALLLLMISDSLLQAETTASSTSPSLAQTMGLLERFTHKLALALQADNRPLAAFYLEEIEEASEFIQQNLPEYEEMPVGELSHSLLDPAVHRLEGELEKGTPTGAAMTALVESCNRCHETTQHGFIRMQLRSDNPYLQNFAPPAER